jgi:hypothetical protein
LSAAVERIVSICAGARQWRGDPGLVAIVQYFVCSLVTIKIEDREEVDLVSRFEAQRRPFLVGAGVRRQWTAALVQIGAETLFLLLYAVPP